MGTIRHAFALVTTVLLQSIGAGPLAAEVNSIEVNALVEDGVVGVALGDSVFRLIASQEHLVGRVDRGGGGGQGISDAYYVMDNPLGPQPDATPAVSVVMELEQSFFASPSNIDEALIGYWFFGILSTIKASDRIAGYVNRRAIYDLVTQIAEELDTRLNLKLKRRRHDIGSEEFENIVDGLPRQ